MPGWWNGRHAGFKIPFSQGSPGSSPGPGTFFLAYSYDARQGRPGSSSFSLPSSLAQDAVIGKILRCRREWSHYGSASARAARPPEGRFSSFVSGRFWPGVPFKISDLDPRGDSSYHHRLGRLGCRLGIIGSRCLGRDHQIVSGVDFLAMLVPHIALRYEVKIRTYGALSTTIRKRFGWIQEDDGESSSPDSEPRPGLVAPGRDFLPSHRECRFSLESSVAPIRVRHSRV